MVKVFVGYDTREDIAYQVCEYQIRKVTPHAEVAPLILKDLRQSGLYWREEDKLGSTEFTFSRFLIPEMTNFKGWALFCDCDILFVEDLNQIFEQAKEEYAVMCVQHDYTPKPGVKMDGKEQTIYPRKNWSSLVLWNCGHPSNQVVNKEFVNDPDTTGKVLHRFSWLKDEEIGSISHEWNWLVGWYKEPEDGKPSGIHYTEGGPWFKDYRNCDYNEPWKKALNDMMNNT
tara:strand:+ start:1425 stop:2111 length:687 start_codon:yes stop_codon:yes gene_type:complete